VYVIIGLVSYLPNVGGSVASFIVSLALACSITFRNCILSPDSLEFSHVYGTWHWVDLHYISSVLQLGIGMVCKMASF
jgi:hypothetical protein